MELHQQTAAELLSGLNEGAFSSVELTEHFLKRIDTLDSSYNSYISTTADLARAQATKADDARAKGQAPALCGLPIAHKDIFCIEGTRTSCGSKMLDNFIAPYTATAVEKLNAAGLVTLGKTNMDEFAMGSSNETSFYGAVSNPWNTDCVPGGSSGGSAAAVAAGLAPWATGTDTGGSIRQPAALCGLTGLKPTYGRVSRYGMIAFASSLDQAGPMARSAEDCALMLQAMSGLDLKDSTSMDQAVPDFSADLNKPLTGLRIGLPAEYLSDALDPEIAKAVQEGINVLKSLGATIKEISLPHTNLAVPCYYIIAPAEASANLSRFDGVRYGYRCKDPKDLEDLYTRSREEGFGDEVKRRILVGAYALSSGYYDAYYKQAQKIRRLIKNDFNAAFADVDLIVGPTAPNPAFKKGEKTNDPVTMYLEDIFTIAVNLAGLPAISMPAGFAKGLPAGMQLIGPDWQEARILNAAHQYQTQTDWHRQTPAQ
jgi:aspartyl-tRNA(Asn)/glutamyl-tRNA(Gln) amidotransferase subunit A